MPDAPVIIWFRRDLRLGDNPALRAAVDTGRPVIALYILDPVLEDLGSAAKWRLGLGIGAFADRIVEAGARLHLARGDALEVLRSLTAATGAEAVHWNRLYDPASMARDGAVKAALEESGIVAESHAGHVLFEPWTVENGSGGFYKVYSPFWRAVKAQEAPSPTAAVTSIRGYEGDLASDRLGDWSLGAGMDRGAAVVAKHVHVGEAAARARLRAFLDGHVADYAEDRNRPDLPDATSGLSENLTCGEIGIREVWAAGQDALRDGGKGAETFLKELVWREFACHLMHHTPEILDRNWRSEWDRFPWRPDNDDAERWRQGVTGEPFVDAAMREMFVTGRMHNRSRMIVASYLTKHLLTDWRVGCAWFEECLIDWDPASNALGWQWTAGSGPDASPFFRIFNPETQGIKFDPDATYRERFVAELTAEPGEEARDYFDAVPRAWRLDPDGPYPDRMIGLAEGRDRALAGLKAKDD